MDKIKFTNFALSQVAASLSNSTTSILVESGHGARFPALTGSDFFYVTLESAALVREIVKVTARAGDTLTVVRGQDGTTAVAWPAGSPVALRLNAAALEYAMESARLSAVSATASAATATTKAGEAATSATAAASSATTATTQATNAATSASTATTQASNASASASAAATSASTATTQASNASTSATNAATSATNAAASAAAAATFDPSSYYNKTEVDARAGNAASIGFRNRIINGDMRIDQRNAGASVTSGFAVDRFEFQENNAAAFTIQRSAVAPAGFVNSMLVTVTTAGSATAAQVNRFFERIEGNNIADLGFGTASASTVTLSFWVRSSLTGTYCASLVNNAANRAYVAEYSISTANTWEYKTITIAGDTTGTWETGTSLGIQVTFDLGSGSDYNATAGSWVAANDFRTTNQVNFANTSGATFYITGVQLEAGSVATPFERRPYGTELALCQRYFVLYGATGSYNTVGTGFAFSTSQAQIQLHYPVQMRAVPSASQSNMQLTDVTNGYSISSLTVGPEMTTLSGGLVVNSSGLTQYRPIALRNNNNVSGNLQLSAEL